MRLDFLKSFDNPLQNILFPKEFLEYNGYISGYVLKFNIGLELVSGVHSVAMKTLLV